MVFLPVIRRLVNLVFYFVCSPEQNVSLDPRIICMRHRRSFSYSSIYFASIQRNNITGEVECTSQQEAATSRSTLHLQNKRQSPDHHCLSTAAQNPSSRDLFPHIFCVFQYNAPDGKRGAKLQAPKSPQHCID